jgi:thioesterase domain-containing protein/acyl carrier protein
MVKSRHWIDAAEPRLQSPAPVDAAAAEADGSVAAQALQLIAQGVGCDLALDDDFYKAGGDSLLAISIVADLNDRFGTSVTLEDFMACPTIGDIVELVCGRPPEAERTRPSFMKVIREDVGPTVFALHPAGGTTFCYRALNRVLSIPFTLIGLDLPDRYAEMASMASLARFYADAVAKEQPSGRIALCGYSFGGNLAVEIGKALAADGREVAPLLMIDALPPETYAGPDSGDHRRMLPGIIAAYQRAKGHEGTGTVPSLEGQDTSTAAAAALGLSEQEASRFADAWFYHYELLRRPPEPGVFPGGARVLRADTALEPALAQTLHLNAVPMQMWRRRFTGPVEIVPVPGDHLSCMADPVGLKAIGMELERWVVGLSEQHRRGTGSS